ncbi:MAG: ice-binding family protein [Chloroflexi bacterium]|nr:ice-binding family protein [Chloroflexota bacterium]
MRKLQNVLVAIILVAALLVAVVFDGQGILAQGSAPSLGAAQSFAVLAGTTATNTGATTISGDLGVSPGSAVTGFPPGIVTDGTQHVADAVALQAQADVTTAYNALAGQACSVDLTGQDLGGMTLTPGVYCFSSSAQLTGALTLNAEGDPAAVFVFKVGSTLTTASNASVAFINGGNQCNVYWQVGSSATLGTGANFAGNILALTSISLNTGASLVGRALARNGAVTMDTNNISYNQCSSASIPTATSPAPTSTATATPTSTVTAAPTSAATAAPTNTPSGDVTVAPTATASPTATSASAVVGVPATGGAAPRRESTSVQLFPSVVLVSAQLLIEPAAAPGIEEDLRAGPENLPLELRIPSLKLNAPVIGVGITAENVMAAPRGSANDPVWWKAFWYRGSGLPGDSGTAAIAGHVVDNLGRPAIFARLTDLEPGSLIIVHNTQSGLDILFRVVKNVTYTVRQAADPSVLAQIYGSGPVSGKGPQPAPDGLSHLTLITCGGDYINGAYASRIVVYAERVQANSHVNASKNGLTVKS